MLNLNLFIILYCFFFMFSKTIITVYSDIYNESLLNSNFVVKNFNRGAYILRYMILLRPIELLMELILQLCFVQANCRQIKN